MSSSAVLITLIICITIIAVALINAVFRNRPMERQQAARPIQKPRQEPSPAEVTSPDTRPALAIDPNNKPYSTVYRPREGSPYPAPICYCHGNPIVPGQKVLFWPLPDSAEIKIFCQNYEKSTS